MDGYWMSAICLLMTCLSVCSAQNGVQVVGQTEPVLAVEGDDVILPCTLRSSYRPLYAVDESVEWQRNDLKPKKVHFYRSREDYNADQNPVYRGRTSLFKEEMRNGNVSLKLTNVKLSDSGTYTCFIPTLKEPIQTNSELIVVPASQPEIVIVGLNLTGVILQCEARGLVRKPEMLWLNSDGVILPANEPTLTETEGRYTVRGNVTVQKTDNNTFTCRVRQQLMKHTMETQIHVSDLMFPEPFPEPFLELNCSWWSGWGFGGLTWGLIVLVVGAVVLCILTRFGLLHWRTVPNSDPQTNGTTSQNGDGDALTNGTTPHNGDALTNGDARSDFLLHEDGSVV
ncbi:hypothetical protein DPEC_G00276450 [Dallia pectoralis]|uniref:Uncharacterized protein n=1 Tax=Dallia pectoralis TaxID=75939 RepID=A0ACC2FLQ5_DALPE|nr:hypothetical protein DPEC_G00276450 [Dallia pectoralis]